MLAESQSTNQFWPEFEGFLKLSQSSRLAFEVKNTREGTERTQSQIGASVEFYVKPLIRLKNLSDFPENHAKSRVLTLSIGYWYLPPIRSPAENRIRLEATPMFPLFAGVVASDKNLISLQFVSGRFNWVYRNRIELQRGFYIAMSGFAAVIGAHRRAKLPTQPLARRSR